MDIRPVLLELGLSEGEITTYLTLLKLGSSQVAKIKEESGLHRTTVYDFLEKLLNKALVNYVVKGGVKYYKAADPNKLIEFLHEKQEKLNQIMPELNKLAKFTKDDVKVEVYKGKEGIKSLLNKVITTGRDMYGFGFEEEKYEQMDPIMMKQYFRKCQELGIKENIFVKRNSGFLFHEKHIRYYYLPDDYFNPNPSMTFGDYVAIHLWEPLMVILIENKNLADAYRKHFNFLKDQSSMIFRGWEEVKQVFIDHLEKLNPNDEIFTYGTSQNADSCVSFFHEHNIIAKQKKLRCRIAIDKRARKNSRIFRPSSCVSYCPGDSFRKFLQI